MADFETIRDAHNELVRAHLHFAILFDSMDNEAVETLEDTVTGELVVPVTAESAGVIEKQAGVSLTHEIDSTDIDGYGDAEPVRTIISRRVVQFQANFLETNKVVLEKFWGTVFDDSNLEVSAHGGVTLKAPSLPKNVFYRAYLVTEDDVNGEVLNAYYIMPRVKLVNVDTQTSQDDGSVSYNMTFQAFKDSDLGFAVLQGWCGPGWLRLVDKTGFVAPVTSIEAEAADASIEVGEDTQITVTGSNGINYTPIAKYAVTTGPDKVSVSKTGEVTGLATGSATVTVTYGGKTQTVSITVSV
ncbi:major tail protein [Mycobacterium phage Skinny]|uniref:Major tail protein n=1 Tax=Mycobacterium phage PegLeg TaxID=1325953 RepID=R4T8V5_9CAUD|nr:major tail protein [Mycobacterium phage PegLeg]AGM12274.1 major tail protein [Mycobacterium phage PegLeg]UXE05231.1 major tail protein [Mycobacterium phage Skinny]